MKTYLGEVTVDAQIQALSHREKVQLETEITRNEKFNIYTMCNSNVSLQKTMYLQHS